MDSLREDQRSQARLVDEGIGEGRLVCSSRRIREEFENGRDYYELAGLK